MILSELERNKEIHLFVSQVDEIPVRVLGLSVLTETAAAFGSNINYQAALLRQHRLSYTEI